MSLIFAASIVSLLPAQPLLLGLVDHASLNCWIGSRSNR
jgi:hypothetical protein